MGRRLGTKPKRSNECGVQADLDSPVHSNAGDDSCITKQILSGAFYGANSEKSVNSKPVQNTPRIQHKDDQSKWARPFHKRSEEKNIRRYSEKKTAGFNSDSKISESTVEPKNWPQSCGVESWGPVHEEPLGKTLEKNEWISNPQNYSSNRDSGRKSSQANPIHDRWTTWVPPEEKEKSYAKGTPPLPPNPKPKAEKLSWKNNDWQWGTPATPKANQECENAEWGMPSPTVSNKIWTEGGKGVDWLPKSYFDSLPDPFKTAPNCGVGRRARVGPDVGSKQRKWKSSTWKKKNTAPSRPLNPEWGGKYSRPQAIFSTSTQEYDCPVKCLDGAPGGQVIGMQPENNCLAFSGSLSSTAPISPMRRVFEWIPSPATDFAGN
ncbi:hypothetical protein BSKO_05693 [Bryopsis sp. KO-2023]|nr:hypothetical protein BSKO_05693 [Bryopsis sp. KO-2023]